MPHSPTNLILYGPPGTGKTYATAKEAVRLCRPELDVENALFGDSAEAREQLLTEYKRLKAASRIDFVTFHQSYAYDDFVEGLRPPSGDDALGDAPSFRLDVKPGIFRTMAAAAEVALTKPRGQRVDLTGRQVFKMSLGRAGHEDHVYEAALDGGYVALGWGGEHDWSDPKYGGKDGYDNLLARWREIDPGISGNSGNVAQLYSFRTAMREGDLVVVSSGNKFVRAIGEITGPYRFDATGDQDYNHRRSVRWLFKTDDPLPVDQIYAKPFVQMSCYRLRDDSLKRDGLARLLPTGDGGEPIEQFVLIIDEINRANISKVFGELITLLEPDKRIGMKEELRVRLPFSEREFGIPANLHIVGTMNTADRSIALLDTALRRRFEFRELMPEPSLLKPVGGIDLAKLLMTLNERIEYLFDREHQIGHAYFMGCKTDIDIAAVMRDRVIPLLAEYFYEDWSKVAAVLGDADGQGRFVTRTVLKSPMGNSADGDDAPRYRWTVKDAFDFVDFAG